MEGQTGLKSGTLTGAVKGFLDVKIPSRKRRSMALFRSQVWKRKCWIVIRADRSPEETGGRTGISVEIYTRSHPLEGTSHPTEGTILHLDHVHKIRRAKSKSHPFAFEIAGRRGESLLYLSGNSETESQKWMTDIRNILWPPKHADHIKKNWTSLGGLYGLMAVADTNLLIKDVHNGTTRVEWPLTSIQKLYLAKSSQAEDEAQIFVIQTRPSHPCGETYLYFYSPDLESLLEGLHEAVTGLITNCAEDSNSIISSLSELSGALSSVVVLPQQVKDFHQYDPGRKSTSVMDISQIKDIAPARNCNVNSCLSSSQFDFLEEKNDNKLSHLSVIDHKKGELYSHLRRRSMSETNLTKLCLDETDEELEPRDDTEDVDLRPSGIPKDRTSSSGSYNSYRSNDSGVRLSASPSTHGDCPRYMNELSSKKFISKSDSVDSGVKASIKDDVRDQRENEEMIKDVIQNKQMEETNYREMNALEEELDSGIKVGAWYQLNAKPKRPILTKNCSVTSFSSDNKKSKGLQRTMSDSGKETITQSLLSEENLKMLDNSAFSKVLAVYEEIKDVLKPIHEKPRLKENDYEELEKCKEIQKKLDLMDQAPPPLPPRKPKLFYTDPWNRTGDSKTNILRKMFKSSFHSKSHSTDSMLELESVPLNKHLSASCLGCDDMARVQVLGTLPRTRKKLDNLNVQMRPFSPQMLNKQKSKNYFGISPNRSPRISRPKHLFLFKSPGKDDKEISPQAELKLHRQFSLQNYRTPSEERSILSPEFAGEPYVINKKENSGLKTPDEGEVIEKDTYLKSPKFKSKTLGFLRKSPKEKSSTLEKKRKSAISTTSISESTSRFPNSFSLENFSLDPMQRLSYSDIYDNNKHCYATEHLSPSSSCIHIPQGTPDPHETANMAGFLKSTCSVSPSAELIWRQKQCITCNCRGCAAVSNVCCKENYYENLQIPDPEYMTADEIRGAFYRPSSRVSSHQHEDDGYLSMGEIKDMQHKKDSQKSSDVNDYMTVDDIYSYFGYNSQPVSSQEYLKNTMHQHSQKLTQPDLRYSTSSGNKSAPHSRKASLCETAEYLTPQEVGLILRRELLNARVRDGNVEQRPRH